MLWYFWTGSGGRILEAMLQKCSENESGQIITTSAEVTLNGGLVRESPQNPLNSGLGIILICPDEYNESFYSPGNDHISHLIFSQITKVRPKSLDSYFT